MGARRARDRLERRVALERHQPVRRGGSGLSSARGFEEAEREYRALQIEANRAFRDGLLATRNYTLSRVDGNSVGSTGAGDDFLEAMAVLDPPAVCRSPPSTVTAGSPRTARTS